MKQKNELSKAGAFVLTRRRQSVWRTENVEFVPYNDKEDSNDSNDDGCGG